MKIGTIVDVRTSEEFKNGSAQSSINIPVVHNGGG